MVMDINSIPTEALEQEQKKRELIKAVMPMQDFQNRMREVHPGISDEAINRIPQGLNNGYNDIAEYINLAKIRTPQGQEQIDLAKQGQFNLPEQTQPSAQSKIAEIMSQISSGYDENLQNGIALNNFAKDPNKTGWNRLGEAIGTGQRILSNPAVQGLIAGAAYGKYRGDALEGLKYGFDWAQNKVKSDYYADKLGMRRGILGGYGKDDYNANVLSQYRETMADNAKLKTQAQLDKTNPKMQDYAETMLVSGLWTNDEYNNFINNGNYVPDQRLNMNVVKEMTNKAYKEKGIQIKDKELAARISHWGAQDSNAAARVANTKANNDRNYQLKKDRFEWEKTHPKGGKSSANNETKNNEYKVRVKAPNGATGTIPEANLQAALKAGYTVIK